ncbi:hypothetical protein [Nannocystis punicea]|uniref:Uncharacterized protein n=1 Tax=Nannocystis punicea TaxID=2995304 RepID=A0ABY7GVE3_9BACT|nr:hypothetical protein [Nannocystis poenicansa]WAS90944.1 hypothetical protein O0S08_32545 [Nannocystis poenicansa]
MDNESQTLAAAIAQQNNLLLQIAADLSAIRKIIERSTAPAVEQQQEGLTIPGAEETAQPPEQELRAGGHKVGVALELEQ